MEAADLALASAAILAGLCCCAALSPSVKKRDEDDDDDDEFNMFRAGGIGLTLYTDDDGETMAADMCAAMIGAGAMLGKCCCFLGLCGTAIAALVLAGQSSDPATIHAVAGSVLGLGVLSFCFSWGFGVFPSESGSIWFHRICMGILCCCSIALVPVLVWWRQSSPLFDAAGDAGSGEPDAPPPPAAPPVPPLAPPMPPTPPMPPFAPPLPRGLAGGLGIAGGSVLLLLLLMGLIAAGKRVEFDEEGDLRVRRSDASPRPSPSSHGTVEINRSSAATVAIERRETGVVLTDNV